MSAGKDAQNVSSFDQSMELGARVRWFLIGNLPGGSKVKRLAQIFDWNLPKARRVLAGEGIKQEDLDAMARRWGWRFVQFIYQPICGPGGLDHVASKLDALESRIDALAHDWAGGPLHFGRAAMGRRGHPDRGRVDSDAPGQAVRVAGASDAGRGREVGAEVIDKAAE